MPSKNFVWPRFVEGPKDGEWVDRTAVDSRQIEVVVRHEGGEFSYYRRKLIFNGQVVVCYAPPVLGTAEVISALVGDILRTHPNTELSDG